MKSRYTVLEVNFFSLTLSERSQSFFEFANRFVTLLQKKESIILSLQLNLLFFL